MSNISNNADKTPPLGLPVNGGQLSKNQLLDETLVMASQPTDYQVIGIKIDDEQSVVFEKSTVTIGRDADNDIMLKSHTVSRKHAEIKYNSGEWFVCDLDSANGTRVNKRKLNSRKKVNENAIIYCGIVKLEITRLLNPHKNSISLPNTKISKSGVLKFSSVAACLMMVVGLYTAKAPARDNIQLSADLLPEDSVQATESKGDLIVVSDDNESQKNHDASSLIVDVSDVNATKTDSISSEINLTVVEEVDSKDVARTQTKAVIVKETHEPIPTKEIVFESVDDTIFNAFSFYYQGNFVQSLSLLKAKLRDPNATADNKDRVVKAITRFHSAKTSYKKVSQLLQDGFLERAFSYYKELVYFDESFAKPGSHYSLAALDLIETQYAREAESAYERKNLKLAYSLWETLAKITDNQEYKEKTRVVTQNARELLRLAYKYERVNVSRSIEYWQEVIDMLPETHPLAVKSNAKMRWFTRG